MHSVSGKHCSSAYARLSFTFICVCLRIQYSQNLVLHVLLCDCSLFLAWFCAMQPHFHALV